MAVELERSVITVLWQLVARRPVSRPCYARHRRVPHQLAATRYRDCFGIVVSISLSNQWHRVVVRSHVGEVWKVWRDESGMDWRRCEGLHKNIWKPGGHLSPGK